MANTLKMAFRHAATVLRHKAVVFHECRACGLSLWQSAMHDMSKFSPTEFMPSARYFQGDRSPIEKEREEVGYSAAWLHHKGHNPHHWEYWCEWDENGGNTVANKIPWDYVVEMVCDWVGAGKVYESTQWTPSSPIRYYNMCRKNRHFHPETEKLTVKLLETIRDKGLDGFHELCKYPGYLYIDYVGMFEP